MIRVLRPGGLLLLADHIAGATWPARAVERAAPRRAPAARPLRQVLAEGLQIEQRERFKLGLVERLAARKPAAG